MYRVTDFTDEEAAILLTLIQDADPVIAMGAIYAVHQLPEEVQDTAFSALDKVSFTSEDERVVNAICEALRRRMSNPTWDPIPSITAFLQKCVSLPEISELKHYSLCSFLARYRWRFPQIVANFCLDRVKYQRSLSEEQRKRYAPTSCLSEHLAPENRPEAEQQVDARYAVLCAMRDELLAFFESEVITIFAFLANGYDATALRVLSEWLESGEEQKVRLVAKLMQQAPVTFVFDNEAFVERLLSTAARIHNDISDAMSRALLSSAMPFGYVVSVIPGQPAREHVQMRDRAEEVAGKYPLGSTMHTFYMTLKREAEYRIEMQWSFREEQNQPKQVIVM